MNNIVISLIISAVTAFFLIITETKKENRTSIGIRTFIATFFVSFIALTYLLDSSCSPEFELGEPNF